MSTVPPPPADWRVPHIDDPVLIPLRDRLHNVVAYAIVDADRANEIQQHSWSLDYRGYAIRASSRDGKQYTVRMHRQILGDTLGDSHVDHINRNKLDNRSANLRAATRSENMLNRGPRSTIPKSGHAGINWDRLQGRWVLSAYIDGKKTRYGSYETVEDALAVAEAEELVLTKRGRRSARGEQVA